MSISFLQLLLGILFLTVVFLHLTKKNFLAVIIYSIQSFIVTLFFLNSFLETNNFYLFLVVLFSLIIKVILAPIFFTRLIKKYTLTFSVSTYFNTPLTLIIIAILTFIAYSEKLTPLTSIVIANQILLSLALSAIFLSLFLIINRKGALSQVFSVLSLENSIVTFAIFANLEQSPGLQVGIIFNIFVLVVITSVFMSMIYKHFTSHDVTIMKNLKD